jgi:hypothetical protein
MRGRGSGYIPRMLRRSHLFTAWLAVMAVAISACSGGSTDGADGASTTGSTEGPASTLAGSGSADVATPVVPPPPALPTVPDDPEAAAAELAAATFDPAGDGGTGAEAAWLAAFDAAGIPVLDDAGRPLGNVDDLLGPAWWEVWMWAGADSVAGSRLPDVLKSVGSTPDGAMSDAAAEEAAIALLDDLRLGAESDDPAARFTVAFLDAKAQQAGTQLSLLDPELDVTQTTLDLPTASLLNWVVIRDAAETLLDEEVVAAGSGAQGFAAPQGRAAPRQAAPVKPCSQLWGDEQVTAVTNSLIGKAFGGVSLPGLEVTGLLEKIVDLNPGIIPKSAFQRMQKLAEKVNVAASLAALLMQYTALDVSGSFETLERTKTTTDGKRATNRVDIVIDAGKLPDGNDKAACAASMLLNAAGISFSFPPAGPVSGVQVILDGGRNFGTRVLFANLEKEGRQDTDSGGSITFGLLGKAQAKELPESARQQDLEYSVSIESTPEALDGNSIFNTFFDSLAFSAKPGLGIVSVAIDIAKTVHWDLGEQYAPLIDWTSTTYEASGGSAELTVSGIVSDVGSPFTITGEIVGGQVTFNYVPASSTAGSLTYEGGGSGVTFAGTGSYTIADGPDGALVLTQTSEGCVDGVPNSCRSNTDVITLTPIP